MDTPALTAAQGRLASEAIARYDSVLAAEIKHSVLLLGGALGLMGSFAVVLLMLTGVGG